MFRFTPPNSEYFNVETGEIRFFPHRGSTGGMITLQKSWTEQHRLEDDADRLVLPLIDTSLGSDKLQILAAMARN